MDRRRDSLAAAAEIILAVERIALAAEPAAVPRQPGSRTIPTRAATSPTSRGCIATCGTSRRSGRSRWRRTLRAGAGRDRRAPARVGSTIDPYATFGPISSIAGLGALLRDKAAARQLTTRDMIAAAGHDLVLIAPLCPSAMLFVPSVDGITHNPREYSTQGAACAGRAGAAGRGAGVGGVSVADLIPTGQNTDVPAPWHALPVSWPAKAGHPRLCRVQQREAVGGRPSPAMTQEARATVPRINL